MVRIILIGLIVLLLITLFISYRKTTEGYESLLSEIEQSASNAVSDVGSGITGLGQDIQNSVTSSSQQQQQSSSQTQPIGQTLGIGLNQSIGQTLGLSQQQPQQPQQQQQQQQQPQSEIVISGPGFDAMSLQQKTELLRDVQKLVKNEVIADRMLDNLNNIATATATATSSQVASDALQQGQEYTSECKKKCEGPCPRNKDGTCPPVPDMSEYIRKDQIPCWNCTLDY